MTLAMAFSRPVSSGSFQASAAGFASIVLMGITWSAPVLSALKQHSKIKQTLIHTGQHYDANMSDVFFQQPEIPAPDGKRGRLGKPCTTDRGDHEPL
jgi:hypothetical protein